MAADWDDRGRSGRRDYGSERGRGSSRGGERDWTDRAGDEVRSWFGDEGAERRRRMEDDREYGMRDDDRGYRGRSRDEYGSGGGYADRGPSVGGSYGGYGSYDDNPRRGYGGNQHHGGYAGRGSSGQDYSERNWSGRSARNHSSGRGYGSRETEDRGFMERAGDEVASWFGDEDAERRREMDARHRGRGPKNYTRSDDRIREDVSDRLSDDAHIDASDIEVSVDSGEVTLSGTVNERFAKRHAEDIAERVSGVKHVQNNLRVSAQQTSGDMSGATAGMSGQAGGVTGSTTGTARR